MASKMCVINIRRNNNIVFFIVLQSHRTLKWFHVSDMAINMQN